MSFQLFHIRCKKNVNVVVVLIRCVEHGSLCPLSADSLVHLDTGVLVSETIACTVRMIAASNLVVSVRKNYDPLVSQISWLMNCTTFRSELYSVSSVVVLSI